MRSRWFKVCTCLLMLAILGAPVAADDFTGSEREYVRLTCPKSGQSVPKNHEPPGSGECTGTATTYMGWRWTNNVKCKSGGHDAQAAKLYTQQAADGGGVGVCNDRNTVPVQGRIVLTGSASKGFTFYADGDKDNPNEQSKGYLRLDANQSGGSVRCGANDGRLDASSPQAGDNQSQCG